MVRLPKSLVALVMAFALLVQASAGSFCGNGCDMGQAGNPHPSSLRSQTLSPGEKGKKDCCGKEVKKKAPVKKGECKCKTECHCPKVGSAPAAETSVPFKLTLPLGFDLLFLVPECVGLVAIDSPTDDIAILASDSGPPGEAPSAVSGSRAPPVK
ncbi:MAG: hypothetical protein K8R88_02845 [Armatimonadetes bacterium]|nr:hypothetical protein [Armatimonadota bacterium]